MELGKTFWFGVKVTSATLITWWIGMPAAFKLLMVLQVLDVVAGCIAANQRQELRSALAWKGIRTKALSWIIVGVVYALQIYAIDTVFGESHIAGMGPAEFAAIGFAVAEGLSIIENAQRIGLPIPLFLTKGLAQTHDATFKDNDDATR